MKGLLKRFVNYIKKEIKSIPYSVAMWVMLWYCLGVGFRILFDMMGLWMASEMPLIFAMIGLGFGIDRVLNKINGLAQVDISDGNGDFNNMEHVQEFLDRVSPFKKEE